MELRSEPEEDLKVMTEPFNEVCQERGLKVNADKNEVIVLKQKVRGMFEVKVVIGRKTVVVTQIDHEHQEFTTLIDKIAACCNVV